MNLQAAVPSLVGDLHRFGPLQDRIEVLIETQCARFRAESGQWLVLPWADGFYLFSEDSEGQRRGKEVVMAFLGPSVVALDAVPDERLAHELPREWQRTG